MGTNVRPKRQMVAKKKRKARVSNDHGEDSSTLVLETSVVASESQREIEQTEGSYEGEKDKVDVYDEEDKQSTMVPDKGQASQVNSKGVLQDMIPSSNSKGDTSVKMKQTMVNRHTRAYHEKGGCGKHEMWSSQILNVSMDLKQGLHGIAKVKAWMNPNKEKL